MTKKSQCDQILAYLRRGKSLTVLEAVHMGIYALSQRCGDLRRRGHPVFSVPIELPNGKRVSCYRMAKY